MVAGKRILVTGAANGCGLGITHHLSAAGAKVFATDIAPGNEFAANVPYRAMDVADREAVFAVVDEAARAMGGIDGIVNAAGIVTVGPAEAATPEQFLRIFNIHVMGTVNTNQAVLPHLKAAGGGSIVNFGSIAGIRGMPGFSVYGSAKGAVLAWTRNTALEWGAYGIRVNAVAPAMHSKMTEEARASRSPDELAALDAATSSATAIRGALGEPLEDLAPLVALLLSDGGSYITGQTISVDGGMMMLGA